MQNFYLGCAVWSWRPWVGGLYPTGTQPRDYLRTYASRLTAVEGNTTFYAVPPASTLEKWREEMPAGFQFCPKIPKALTHEGALGPRIDEALSFGRYLMDGLGRDRLGPFFVQLPPSYGPDRGADLAGLLNAWRRAHPGVPVCVEVRHPRWFQEPWGERLDTMLDRMGFHRVLLDTRPVYSGLDDPQVESQRRKPRLPLQPVVTGGTAFVRYIGHPTPARNDAFLEEWAARVEGWLRADKQVYFFAHCPIEDHSPAIARQLQRLLEARGAPVPSLPWDGFDDAPAQQGLFV